MIEAPENLISLVLNAAFAVHTELGPGLLESVYQKAMMIELRERNIPAQSEVEVDVRYHGENLGMGFRVDILVDEVLIVELKSVTALNEVHLAQILSYQKILGIKRGLLLNFGELRLKDGIKRVSI